MPECDADSQANHSDELKIAGIMGVIGPDMSWSDDSSASYLIGTLFNEANNPYGLRFTTILEDLTRFLTFVAAA